MYPVTDMFNRIRNAQAVVHQTVDVPFSNFKYEIAKILVKNGFIKKIEKKGKKVKKSIEITLKYQDKTSVKRKDNQGLPVISGLKIISRPGQKIYIDYQRVRKVKGGYGIVIISTSKGLMTGKEARKQKLGGEVICEVW